MSEALPMNDISTSAPSTIVRKSLPKSPQSTPPRVR